MDQNELTEIFNRHLFREEKRTLLSKIADNPDRFVGIFRSTSPRLKLIQNLLQSREIRYGDALEEIMAKLISEMGFIHLDKGLLPNNGEKLSCDHYFTTPDRTSFYLVEQKIRDDHDSTKKRGQFENFRSKILHLSQKHGAAVVGIIYFIDPTLTKNKNYYHQRLVQLREELKVPLYLFYNGELFTFLQGSTAIWDNLVAGLQSWQNSVPEGIDEFFNFDNTPEETLAEIQAIEPRRWYKLLVDDRLWTSNLMVSLFPTGTTLLMLRDFFLGHSAEKFSVGRSRLTYAHIAALLQQRLETHYNC